MTRERTMVLRPFSSALLLPLLLVPSTLALNNDFSLYPLHSQDCLYNAGSVSLCSGQTSAELNSCLCTDGGSFITLSAKCIGAKDRVDLQPVYSIMARSCLESNTPITISMQDFVAIGTGQYTSSSTSSAATVATTMTTMTTSTAPGTTSTDPKTTTPAPAPAPVEDNSSTGMSQGAKVGVGAGVGVAGLAAIGALAFFLIRRAKKKPTDESNPMLSQDDYYKKNSPTTFPPVEPSSGGLGQHAQGSDNKQSWSPGVPPGYKSYSTASESPSPNPMAFSAPPPPNVAIHGGAPHIHEMDGSTPAVPVEMEGSSPATGTPRQ